MGTKIMDLPNYVWGKDLSIFYSTKYSTCRLKDGSYKVIRNFPISFDIELPFKSGRGDLVRLENNIFSSSFRYEENIDQFLPISFASKNYSNQLKLKFDLKKFNGIYGIDSGPKPDKAYDPEPKNNDGRSRCYWCGEPTKVVKGFSFVYSICENCGK